MVKITRKKLVEKRLLVCRRILRVDTQRLRCQLMVKLKKVAVEEDEESMSLDAVIANPTDLRNRLDVQFVVDTGASMTAITAEMAKSLGLKYVATAEVGLADGRVIKVNLAYAYLFIHGEHVFTLVGCGGCDVPLLGFDVISVFCSCSWTWRTRRF